MFQSNVTLHVFFNGVFQGLGVLVQRPIRIASACRRELCFPHHLCVLFLFVLASIKFVASRQFSILIPRQSIVVSVMSSHQLSLSFASALVVLSMSAIPGFPVVADIMSLYIISIVLYGPPKHT